MQLLDTWRGSGVLVRTALPLWPLSPTGSLDGLMMLHHKSIEQHWIYTQGNEMMDPVKAQFDPLRRDSANQRKLNLKESVGGQHERQRDPAAGEQFSVDAHLYYTHVSSCLSTCHQTDRWTWELWGRQVRSWHRWTLTRLNQLILTCYSELFCFRATRIISKQLHFFQSYV